MLPGIEEREVVGKRLASHRAVAAAAASVVLAGGMTLTSAEPASAVPAPSRQLFAVAATSTANAWAVGRQASGAVEHTLIEHWNGRSWRPVRSVNPPGSDELLGVTAVSARSAWAVGFTFLAGRNRTLIEHWNGRSWTRVRSPNPCGRAAPGDSLAAVTALSTADAWAVGTGTSCAGGQRTLILRWNGRSWRQIASPSPGTADGNSLTSVAASSARNAWAVGQFSDGTVQHTLTVRWNGKSWRHVSSPDAPGAGPFSQLDGVAVTSATNAWAVGSALRTNPTRGVIVLLHWNGRSWRTARGASLGNVQAPELVAVTAVSARTAWAVGDLTNLSPHADKTLIERWDGRRWRRVPSPTPGGGAHDLGLFGVAALSGRSAWAIGSFARGTTEHALTELWNGRVWRFA